jgi:Co/Zn/Cd efflux system component
MRYGLLRNDGPAPRSSGHEGYLAGLHSSWNWQQPLKDLTPTERSLAIVGAVNLVYVFLQLGAASATGSLAMLSDAFHNLRYKK